MKDFTNKHIQGYVRNYIDGDPSISLGIQRGLISSRILTKHILQEKKEFKGNFETVRNAVRKYSDEASPQVDVKEVYMAFRNSFVDIRGNLVSVKISRKEGIKKILKIIDELSIDNESFIRLMNNEVAFHLLIDNKKLDKLTKNFSEDKLTVRDGICAVTIHLDPAVKNTPGVYFILLGQIALHKINVFDVSTYGSEVSIYVDKADAAETHRILYELCEYQKRFCSAA
ncbi:hypothetical protein KY320_00430 [Candidatus Woesearchaeota archaeon]|nr:hypothetical protein [Candidatus Woesearchaeota archaeon]